jgi:hypothetical protein
MIVAWNLQKLFPHSKTIAITKLIVTAYFKTLDTNNRLEHYSILYLLLCCPSGDAFSTASPTEPTEPPLGEWVAPVSFVPPIPPPVLPTLRQPEELSSLILSCIAAPIPCCIADIQDWYISSESACRM